MELRTSEFANFQIPAGSYNVYENTKNLTFLGRDNASIKNEDEIIKLEIGKTNDITCTFNTKEYFINRDNGELEISATFTNYKNKKTTIYWTENFSDSRWNIIDSNHEYERLDAFNTEFKIRGPIVGIARTIATSISPSIK